jgi:tol-pal system protein YbgF
MMSRPTPGVCCKGMPAVRHTAIAERKVRNHRLLKLLPLKDEWNKGTESFGVYFHRTSQVCRKLVPRLFALIVALVSLSGCLTRTVGPSLPYVRPAQSVPAVDPVPIQLSSRLQEMDNEIQRLREMIERLQAAGGNENAIRNLQERVNLIERHLGMESVRSAGSPSVPPPLPSTDPRVQRQPRAENRPADGYIPAPPSDQSAGPPVEIANAPIPADEKAYRDAYALFKGGSMDQAVFEFEDFLKKFPKSQFAADSVYWIGEARFAQGRFDEAVLQFDRVLKDFPGSKKELSALLRQGQAFEKMGDNRSAKIIFQKLITDHPHTAQARIAGGKLKSLAAE